MRSFIRHVSEQRSAWEVERDRMRAEIVSRLTGQGMSRTQAVKRAKREVERWGNTAGAAMRDDHDRAAEARRAESEARRERSDAAARIEVASLMSRAQGILRRAGFRSERRAQGGSESRYYSRGPLRVRISDHEIPMTPEREHSRSIHGAPWTEFVFAMQSPRGIVVRREELDRLSGWVRELDT